MDTKRKRGIDASELYAELFNLVVIVIENSDWNYDYLL